MNALFHVLQSVTRDKTWLTLSNMLTLLRIILAPCVFIAFLYKYILCACIIFVIASVTDLLDGYYARRMNQQTYLGVLIDPIADKCLLLSSFFSLWYIQSPSWCTVPTWFFIGLMIREMIMIIGAIIILLIDAKAPIKPLIWGKVTTLLQILLIVSIFACHFFQIMPCDFIYPMMYGVFLFSIITICIYIYTGIFYVM